MKKILLSAALILAGLGSVHANDSSQEVLNDDAMSVFAASVDGVYAGKATPTIMNGLPVTSGKSYDCEYSIESGYFSGSFTVGPHTVTMNSEEEITGVGTYVVFGEITLLGRGIPFDGTITVTAADGSNLEFSCHVETKNFGAVSEFSFVGTK